MSSVVNVYDLLPKKYRQNKYINPNPLMPQHPFRLCLVGASGSGKTNILYNIIEQSKNFHKIYLYAKKLDEDLYRYLIDVWTKKSTKAKEQLIVYSDSIDDIATIDSVDVRKQNLFVFDDLVTERHVDKIGPFWIRGRKSNISSVFISQSYFMIPKLIRDNSNYFILTKQLKGRDLTMIAHDHSGSLDKETFKRLYRHATQKQFDFFFIDNETIRADYKIRKNFNYSLTANRQL